ncbi:hypothetical protein J6590_015138 [Homalodisca vitripennis]|nr:hypothetical protein J6590_015138 [Homalodisca vitripennis]
MRGALDKEVALYQAAFEAFPILVTVIRKYLHLLNFFHDSNLQTFLCFRGHWIGNFEEGNSNHSLVNNFVEVECRRTKAS